MLRQKGRVGIGMVGKWCETDYMLAQIGPGIVGLISLNDGNRYSDAGATNVEHNDNLTYKEFTKVCHMEEKDTEVIQFWNYLVIKYRTATGETVEMHPKKNQPKPEEMKGEEEYVLVTPGGQTKITREDALAVEKLISEIISKRS